MPQIITATIEADFEAARRLCWEYRDVLLSIGGRDADAVLHYYDEATYQQLMEDLPSLHAPPGGALRLVVEGGTPIGCGMIHTLEPGIAEIKRVYLRQAARGAGLGRRLMEDLIGICRDRGFEKILMDTGNKLTAANALYRDLGFTERGPYHSVPEDLRELLVFYEMAL